ncbi:LamB/YcsF family protein [Pseudomonas peli]|uniref:LamB/YcsF family protein n=1 Tax=Pseudomonas peli TaxID=592361 RepID=UPI0024AD0F45|nr:LamB/YcsF family protein [Pseudomonas peli]
MGRAPRPATIIEQALSIARGEPLIASDGSACSAGQTLCVHGDNASSVAAVQRIARP